MKPEEIKEKWEKDKPVYEAWAKYLIKEIKNTLVGCEKNIDSYFKIPPTYRLKKTDSLVDKASRKKYSNPYTEIEDKAGVRFVVLVIDEVKEVCDIIERRTDWCSDKCRDFEEERNNNPTIFIYQSVHYVIKPKKDIDINRNLVIPAGIPCEVQVRTLLQHAHAELTHDEVYKSNELRKPEILRHIAKSMALIETTDDFFNTVVRQLNESSMMTNKTIQKLNQLYQNFTGDKPKTLKSTLILCDQFSDMMGDDLCAKIDAFIQSEEYNFLRENIKNHVAKNEFYRQSIILFLYWMLEYQRSRLIKEWPLKHALLEPLASDIGVNISPA